jgi:hypothetical protein
LGREKRGGSTANVNRVKGVEVTPVHRHLFEEDIQKKGKGRERGGRIEVAIRTFAEAIRNVNVESGILL